MSKKYVFEFGGGKADGKAEMKELLGGKGANLAEMASLGIPVPRVSLSRLKFAITTISIINLIRPSLKLK